MKVGKIQTVGIVGGNVLASMLCIEAKKRGLKTILLEPEVSNIASEMADAHMTAVINSESIHRLALKTDVIVFCSTQLPVLKQDFLERYRTYPSEDGVSLVANRVEQLTMAQLAGVPVPNFYHQSNKEMLFDEIDSIKLPFKLYQIYNDCYKTIDVYTTEDMDTFMDALDEKAVEWLIEEVNDYTRYLSVTALKVKGKIYTYPIQEEALQDEAVKHIYMPADVTKTMGSNINKYVKKLLKEIETEGLFTFKFGIKTNRSLELIYVNPGITVGDISTNHYSDFSVYEQFLNLIEGYPVKDGEVIKPSVVTVIKAADVSHMPKFPYHHYVMDKYNRMPVSLFVQEDMREQ